MPVGWDDVGGRDDIVLADDHDDLGRWRIEELPLLEADEIGGRDEFPTLGVFALSTEIQTGREIYVRIYEDLRDKIDEQLEGESLLNVGIKVRDAEKEGEGETDRWRFDVDVAPLGPPDEAGP